VEFEAAHGLLESRIERLFVDRHGQDIATALAQPVLHESAGQSVHGSYVLGSECCSLKCLSMFVDDVGLSMSSHSIHSVVLRFVNYSQSYIWFRIDRVMGPAFHSEQISVSSRPASISEYDDDDDV
jgi:hypothetical protein